MSKWKSVESIPKDGTHVIVWCTIPESSGGVIFYDVHMRGDGTGFGYVVHSKNFMLDWEYLEREEGIFPKWNISKWRYPLKPPKE